MAENALDLNITFPIYNADGTPFNGLVLHKSAVDSVVMSLGDNITGDVYYRSNSLVVTMNEYIEYKGVRYVLVNPPTIVREGMVSDNASLNGMTKYSFTFYHPMHAVSSFPFCDVAVSSDQEKYLSQNKSFAWMGTGNDFIAKLNKNLDGTQWIVVASTEQESVAKLQELSGVLTFDNVFISDALKTLYDTWKVPFVIDSLHAGEYYYTNTNNQQVDYYNDGKRFVIIAGLPSNEILDANNQPFVFQFGQGVGLKNNSRTPRNNKIVTRISGYGSEDNVPWGYPQIPWTGDQSWEYTIQNDSTQPNSYPIYDGIVGGQKVRLIKHPFTRTHLMPSIYSDTVNKKVNPLATGYDPTIEIKDYYDATAAEHYPNPMVAGSPSYEIHGFDDIKPRLGDNYALVSVSAYDDEIETISKSTYNTRIQAFKASSNNDKEKEALQECYDDLGFADHISNIGGSYTFSFDVLETQTYSAGTWYHVKYTSGDVNFEYIVYDGTAAPSIDVNWDDTMDDDGNYVQSYFKVTLPALGFDLYASAAVTQAMQVNMRSGLCLGCTFPIQCDWEDYKKNFYDADGNFDPVIGEGHPRNAQKYPDSTSQQITVILQKETETFGILMPNIYQQPTGGDRFVILGISLPLSYISSAERELDDAMKEYMLENNVYYFDYPLKFDEHFLATHKAILDQIRNNTIVRFVFGGQTNALYVKQITVKYGEKPLPQYDITLTDDVEIVLNKIGQVTDDVSRLRVQLNELQKYYGENFAGALNEKLSKVADDVALGKITFQEGIDVVSRAIFRDEMRSPDFETGLYGGRGWRVDNLGNAEFESLRIRSFLEVVELLVNRMRAQEGDTLFTDNDQIDLVQEVQDPTHGTTYILSLKEKYDGYVTAQMYGNVIKGIINTLAAKQAGVSDVNDTPATEHDGDNSYYTSWMRVIGTHATNNQLSSNQIQVVLYGDAQVPSQHNFKPCELMTIARWGCVDYSDPTSPDYEQVKASIERRQRVFAISVTDGRVTKYTGVDAPILKNGNYGITIGELPEFVKNYSKVHEVLEQVGEHSDWLYAQGIVVGNYIKITREGLPEIVYVDCGEWVDGSQVQDPTPRNGIYLFDEWNDDSQQFETNDVWHEGHKWRCLQHQPVVIGGVSTYYEPKWNSPYWKMIEGNSNYSLEFESSKGYSFRRGFVDTAITPHLFYGNTDISADVIAVYWNWTRSSESGKTTADTYWDNQHTGLVTGVKTLHLTNLDMPQTWSSADKAIFTCTVTINDGNDTITVQNSIIS